MSRNVPPYGWKHPEPLPPPTVPPRTDLGDGGWRLKEFDTLGFAHGQDRYVPCPDGCGDTAREAVCYDVGGHWWFCPTCGVLDC